MGFQWTVHPRQEIIPNLKALPKRVQKNLEAAGERIASIGERNMKSNAPWTDRTGEARAGLSAFAVGDKGSVTIYFVTEAEHGKWLEITRGGKHAIVWPTIVTMGSDVAREVSKILD